MSIKINKTEATKTIINALDAMKADANINLGIEEIEFPDGSKENSATTVRPTSKLLCTSRRFASMFAPATAIRQKA